MAVQSSSTVVTKSRDDSKGSSYFCLGYLSQATSVLIKAHRHLLLELVSSGSPRLVSLVDDGGD